VLSLITREGFNMKAARPGGLFGSGIYFAQSIASSLGYIHKVSIPSGPGYCIILVDSISWQE